MGFFKSNKSISIDELHDLLEGRVLDNDIVIDVREPEEVAETAIAGIPNIPLGELPERLDQLKQYANVYLLCRSGQRSAVAAELLRGKGIACAANIAGGIMAWKEKGYPVV